MAQETKKYSRTLSGSIGAGMKSLFGGNERRYYILEHKVTSKYHKAGENQPIIVDQIEIGRDPKSQVRFDDKFGTVSRRHAAIVSDGDNWKLVQLSKTNSTYLNGHKIDKEWYLQNGDEIQLSTNGPKLGFIVPEGKKGTVGSLGLTRRMSLFRQQALRPYKQAIISLSCVLVVCLGTGIWKIVTMEKTLEEKSQQIVRLINENTDNQQKADSLAQELITTNRQMSGYEERIQSMGRDLVNARAQANAALQKAAEAEKQAQQAQAQAGGVPDALKEQCFPYTYAIYQTSQKITLPDGEVYVDNDPKVVGTGFLMSDGRFVTARHVTETHYYDNFGWDEKTAEFLKSLNAVVHSGGDVETSFVAISKSGDKIKFTNKQVNADRSHDTASTFTREDGMTVVLKHAQNDANDWVSLRTDKNGMPFDATGSSDMRIGTNLQILGFPYGRGAEDPDNVSPISSHAEVARDGLDVNGTIMTSNDDTQSGNSGGPVMAFKDGKYQIVGILSGSTANKGRVIPINVVH